MIGYFEEIDIGQTTEVGSHLFTAEEIKRYARRFDPQRFHVDEELARSSLFGELVASGWHTGAIWARLAAEYQRRHAEEQRNAQGRAPRPGPYPALRKLKWLQPVRVGDVIAYSSEVIAKSECETPENWGLITLRNTGINQSGVLVIEFQAELMVERRPQPAGAG